MLKSAKHKKFLLDLLILLAWTIFTLVFVLVPFLSNTFVRTMLGLPMVLFIPGYMLISVLFPKKDDLETVERIALSFGLSIAVAPILGLILNFTYGIKLIPLLTTLCLYTIVLGAIAAYRREGLPEQERFFVPFHRLSVLVNELNASKNMTDIISNGILIFSIVLAIGVIFFVITTPKIGEKFTEFYILGPDGKAENYTTDLKYNSPDHILVGVVNHEYASVNYTMRVALENDILTDTWFRLNQNETWEQNVTFVPDKIGKDIKLEFWLFKEDNFTAPYRELHLWVNIAK